MIPGLLLWMVLSLYTCWFHNMVILPTWHYYYYYYYYYYYWVYPSCFELPTD
jgi:hypothetical protein